jgi:hypothetical protein
MLLAFSAVRSWLKFFVLYIEKEAEREIVTVNEILLIVVYNCT